MSPKDTRPKSGKQVLTLGADLSPAVKAIEAAYRMIQRRHKDVPDATIVVKRDARAWGHTTVGQVWSANSSKTPDRYEIMISGENLARGAREVAATLLHEAAHARNLGGGVLDTDQNGRHNKRFAASAEHLGLTVQAQGWVGYSITSLTDEQALAWRQVIDTIDRGLKKSAKAHRPAPAKGGKGKPGTGGGVAPVGPRRRGDRNLKKGVCACGFSIRASKGVFEKAVPTCSICEQPFAIDG